MKVPDLDKGVSLRAPADRDDIKQLFGSFYVIIDNEELHAAAVIDQLFAGQPLAGKRLEDIAKLLSTLGVLLNLGHESNMMLKAQLEVAMELNQRLLLAGAPEPAPSRSLN